jgi:RecB family exonuclease
VITPRTTRLVRVPDLQGFRAALVDLCCGGAPLDARDRLVVVPTRAARAHLVRTIENARLGADRAVTLPEIVTPGDLPERFAERLPHWAATRVLTAAEREVLLAAACRAAARAGHEPPFHVRPGLVAEILALYDALRRNQKDVATFERLVLGILDAGAIEDRGAERLARQTRFLAAAFRAFEERCAAVDAHDEHLLRRLAMAGAAVAPWRHVVLAVGDLASDRFGLPAADWDMLARVPGLERLDVVATDARVAGPFHERIHQWLPGIEEVRLGAPGPAPVVLTPAADALLHVARDREEEIAGFARLVRAIARRGPLALDRIALVVRRPLPYVYVTREVLSSAGVPVQMFDALPLAAEPYAAALDLVIAFVHGQAARRPAIALLRSPHFRFATIDGDALPARAIAALDKALSEAGYLGEVESLERLVDKWHQAATDRQLPQAHLSAADVLLRITRQLEPLRLLAPAAEHLQALLNFLAQHETVPGPDDPLRSRQLRARAAVHSVLISLRDAHGRFDDEPAGFEEVASMVRRWLDGHTFAPREGESGVHLVDADSAPFGDFRLVQLAGLIDGEWPERPRRNIFYSPAILRELGWPSEADRLDAVRSAFRDLLRLPSETVVVSAFTLEVEAIVSPSALVDELEAATLQHRVDAIDHVRIFEYEAMALEPMQLAALPADRRERAVRRVDQAAVAMARVAGHTGAFAPAAFSVSSLERYQDCPFKYFAADVLRLDEPLDDEPSLSPRARGRFIHEVFQQFFAGWDRRGGGTITDATFDEARALFEDVAEELLARLPDADAALERTRLFGSAIATGIVDVVLGLEASRPVEVTQRWLEHRLDGEFALGDPAGRRVMLRGVADRIDLLEGNRLRVIDYKSGSAPQPSRALQVAIYALSAQERFSAEGSTYAIDEAAYVAFSGKRALVPVVRAGANDAADTLASARERLFGLIDGVRDGVFPPQPYELRICGFCAYPSVCRKDYVGDE